MARASVIGPLLHQLFPSAKIKDWIHLKELTSIFTILRHSYPHVQAELSEAKGAVPETSNEHMMLQNLWFLFEFYIPLVNHLRSSFNIQFLFACYSCGIDIITKFCVCFGFDRSRTSVRAVGKTTALSCSPK